MNIKKKIKLNSLAVAALLLGIVFCSLSTKNVVHATDLPVTYKSGVINYDETWTAGNVYYIINNVTVNNGATLYVEPGTIIKAETNGAAISVNAGAKLEFNGNASERVILTSYKDDSVGGDSNNDGNSVGSTGDYALAIDVTGGVIDISFAIIRHANFAIDKLQPGSARVVDSEIQNTIRSKYPIALQRNTIEGMSYYNFALDLYNNSDISDVNLSGTNRNIFTGQGKARVIHIGNAKVPAAKSWSVDAVSGAILFSSGGFTIDGQVNIGAGAILKLQNGEGVNVTSGGQLNMTGSSLSPVRITSYEDDTIGGDSNYDGSSSGSKNNYGQAIGVSSAGTLHMSYASISYANTAIMTFGQAELDNTSISHVYRIANIYGGHANFAIDANDATNGFIVQSSTTTLRGNVDISDQAIEACNWNNPNCSVDASYTDWGSVSGPTQVCGKVLTLPWKYNGVTHQGSDLYIPNCDSSPPPSAELNSAITNYQTRIQSKQVDCNNGWQDACQAIDNAFACLSGAVNVAGSTSPFALPQINTSGDIDTFGATVRTAATDHVRGEAVESVTGLGNPMAGLLNQVIGLFGTLRTAYNNCAP